MEAKEDNNLYTGQYSWTIKGNTLSQMVTAKNEEQFVSDTFQMASMNWCVEVFPNGHRHDNVGAFKIFLKLLSSPQNGSRVIAFSSMCCKEYGSSTSAIASYKEDEKVGWEDYVLGLNEIINSNSNQLTLTVNISILRIINESWLGTTIIYEYDVYYNNSFDKQSFEFNIDKQLLDKMKSAYNGKAFESPIYNQMWRLRVAPNGTNTSHEGYFDVAIVLCAIPKYISKMSVRYQMKCKEIQINTDRTKDFDITGFSCNGGLWAEPKEKVLSFTQFENCELTNMTLSVHIDCLELYDNNSTKINKTEWNQYVNVNQNSNEIEEKKQSENTSNINNVIMQSLITRMDEMNENISSLTNIIQTNAQMLNDINNTIKQTEVRVCNLEEHEHTQKESDSKLFMSELNKVKEQISQLMQLQSNNNDENKEICEEEKVRNWMKDTVKLDIYSQLLIDNGFDTMESIIDLTMEELMQLGIDKMGHRKRIFKHIQTLKSKHQSKGIIKPINNPPQLQQHQQQSIATAYLSVINQWKCEMCDTNNLNSSNSCKLCGLKTNYMNTEMIEDANEIATAK